MTLLLLLLIPSTATCVALLVCVAVQSVNREW